MQRLLAYRVFTLTVQVMGISQPPG